ncbi:unnamed protein product [Effrenium voratum]|uniref:Uncharacterized protein n=1 Tax=Effrenium voratum TaxID=2562239 RepID=A0AA36IT32_9DINO|nr:unnamed protein product [Effrenium voratum]
MEVESQLRRLRKSFEEQAQELCRLSSELGHQSRIVKVLDESLQQTSQQTCSLEYRLSNLEHEREVQQRSTRSAFESLGARVTELGLEVAELPTAEEIKDGFRQLEHSIACCEAQLRQELGEAMRQLSVTTEASLSHLRKDSDLCRRDLDVLHRQLWGDEIPSAPKALEQTEPSALAAEITVRAPSQALPALPPLAKRLGQAEDRLHALDHRNKAQHEEVIQRLALKADEEDMIRQMARKSDLGHTHDCLVSADGSSTFAL